MDRLKDLNSLFGDASKGDLVKTKIFEEEKIALLQLNPATKLIFLSLDLVQALSSKLRELEEDPRVSAVVLTGKGNSFATGASIAEIKASNQKDMVFNDFFEREWGKVANFKKPLIAAINGYALGGGLELAMMCDILIASDKALLGQPEIKLGIIPGAGGTVRLTSLVGKSKTMEMVLTGAPIKAEDALKWGIVSQVHPHDKLLEEVMKTAKQVAAQSQIATAAAKRSILAS